MAPAIIPVGTVLYHGRADPEVPTIPEWLAFDFEHAYMFARGSNAHMLTLASKRALKVIDLDGLSAHLSPDTQEIIMFGEIKNDTTTSIPQIAVNLCAWGAKNGIDGFIRMEVILS